MFKHITSFGLLAMISLGLAVLGWLEFAASQDTWDLGFALAFTVLTVLGVRWQIKENRASHEQHENLNE